MNDAERLTAYRKMQDFVDRRLAIRPLGWTACGQKVRKDRHIPSAAGDKLQYQNMMELYKMFGL